MSKNSGKHSAVVRAREMVVNDPDLAARLSGVLRFSARVRASEYHVTNACNLRCHGCWFFANGHDSMTKEAKALETWKTFLQEETRKRRVNCALVIGGEPTLFQDRLRIFHEHFRYMSISTNGLKKLPMEGFEDVAIGVTLFGGGALDDNLRGIKPNGRQFTGLLDTALNNYHQDPRVGFIYAVTEAGIEHIEPTIQRIADNGNKVVFNFYSDYTDELGSTADRLTARLLDECLKASDRYRDTVLTHPYVLEALLTGQSHFGKFGYDVCPSISVDHPSHVDRLANGNASLTHFNSYAADGKTVNFCCTSGDCDNCRDGQAIQSWMLVSLEHFLGSAAQLRTWIEISESYWRQFIWSPFHWTQDAQAEEMPQQENERPTQMAASR